MTTCRRDPSPNPHMFLLNPAKFMGEMEISAAISSPLISQKQTAHTTETLAPTFSLRRPPTPRNLGPDISFAFLHEGLCRLCQVLFKTFGDRVKNWMTFSELRVVAALTYDDGKFAPGRCTNCPAGNSAEPYIIAHNLIFTHTDAVQRY